VGAGFGAAAGLGGATGFETTGFRAVLARLAAAGRLAAGLRAAVFLTVFFAFAVLRRGPDLRADDFAPTLRLRAATFFAFLALVFFAFFDFLAVAMTSSCFRCYALPHWRRR
jgi:hypothetical protein